jgi:putative transposase
VDILGFCLTPNHFHFVIRKHADGDLGRFMQRVPTAHARRSHSHYNTTGHVWQGRFKAFPIQEDEHQIAVLRYVERNALRAELAAKAEDWKWSSLSFWLGKDPMLWKGKEPVRDRRWLERVKEPLPVGDLRRLRLSVERGRPYGEDKWTEKTARQLGLKSTLRSMGRPRKTHQN